MGKLLAISIPTVGRSTLAFTIQSSIAAKNLYSNEIEINCFYNGIDSNYLSAEISSTQFQITYSPTRIPPWHSMRAALAMGDAEYFWLLGDDDRVDLDGLPELITFLQQNQTDILILNATDDDFNGNKSPAPAHHIGQIRSRNLPLILGALTQDLNVMNNGRFIISKRVRDCMLQKSNTLVETFHEEYRALYESLIDITNQGHLISVSGIHGPSVILGNIEKSWSSKFFQAQLGEAILYQNLSGVYDPIKSEISMKIVKRLMAVRSLIWFRKKMKSKIIIEPFEHRMSLGIRLKITVLNLLPIQAIYSIDKMFKIAEKIRLISK